MSLKERLEVLTPNPRISEAVCSETNTSGALCSETNKTSQGSSRWGALILRRAISAKRMESANFWCRRALVRRFRNFSWHMSKHTMYLICGNFLLSEIQKRHFYFIPRRWNIFSGPLWGPNLISFCLISYPWELFLISICWRYLLIFDPQNLYPPEVDHPWLSTMWSPFEILSGLFLP